MIVIGYIGIGKSTLAMNQTGYIDLDSSTFMFNNKRCDNWVTYYCQVAESLSKQGYVVSCHFDVIEYFKKSDERAIIIHPSIQNELEWKKKVKDRYENSKTDKDYKAWIRCLNMFKPDIAYLMTCGIPHFELDDNYDLNKFIRDIIEKNQDILNVTKIKEDK